ncbi:hypothetical protein [Lysinibacillus sp. RS5]|uniref:hypothetical protein n=1 Tax=unclassified Lysinibacillus TaxID=2636778 RepID=UPI0035BE30EF
MNVTVEIIDTFPQYDTYAIARVSIDAVLSLVNVKLKRGCKRNQYIITLSDNDGHNLYVELHDNTLAEKIFDAMVYQYERFILDMFNKGINDIEYQQPARIYVMEKDRIEMKNRKLNYTN